MDGVWRVNSEASPYRHVAMLARWALVRQMLLPTTPPRRYHP